MQQKINIILESKKDGFKREIWTEYGMGKATISTLLKNQKNILDSAEEGKPAKYKADIFC